MPTAQSLQALKGMEIIMKYGFVRVAAATPKIKIADCSHNADKIMEYIRIADGQEVKLIVFPELCVTGYTCGDLFLQETLLCKAKEQVKKIADFTAGRDVVAVVGFPFEWMGKLYNTAAVLQGGRILGMVPKMSIPNYSEFYEARHFTSGIRDTVKVDFMGEEVDFGSRILFRCRNIPEFILGVEICEDLWIPISPGISHCIAGGTVIANLSASDELVGKDEFRRDLVKSQSARLRCGYIYADAGEGESTTDMVFAGHNLIAENGTLLAESAPFENDMTVIELDLGRIKSDRRRMNTYPGESSIKYTIVPFSIKEEKGGLKALELIRKVNSAPFVPSMAVNRNKRCRDIFNIQALGLKSRLEHTGQKCSVIGISGGLDSTLALLVAYKAFELLSYDRKGIIAVTMPCFGTTDRTYRNALELAGCLGVTVKEIPIREAVELHFRDIGKDATVQDTTYENSQARERTQVLMDLANLYDGLVVGTGDMSELALGWATYNGDHMSMYGVNSSIPKTLVRFLVEFWAGQTEDKNLKRILADILDTPVSPELLPPVEGKITQKTEDIVGPYELHDFFLYYILRFGFGPKKVYHLAGIAFRGSYANDEILKWLKIFYRRFFSQQYKRSCLPDGPKVGTISVSPRGDLRMPSDASSTMWLEELEQINP